MNSQKGVTLTSLVIYIILVFIVLGILGVVTSNFQNNVKNINAEGTENVEIDKFNVFFLKEVKKTGNQIDTIENNEISFKTGNKYTFNNIDKCIYLNENVKKIKIAEDITKCEFSQSLVDGKTIIIVTIKAKNSEERNIEYVLSDSENTYTYEDEGSYTHRNALQEGNIESN